MYQVIGNVADKFLNESLGESNIASSQKYWYYWEAKHRPAFEWKLVGKTGAMELTAFQAMEEGRKFSTDWDRKLLGGFLYIGRYSWNGNSWQRDRCLMRDKSGKWQECAK